MTNYYEEVCKIMFQDGFHITENHGVWKLKKKLTPKEWGTVKQFFKYYNKNDENIRNSKYHGWMTTDPVSVMIKLKFEDNLKLKERLC